jgi:hypothetical protein
MALRTKRHPRAVLATLGRVMFIPWLAMFLLFFLSIGGRGWGPGAAMGIFFIWFLFGFILESVLAVRAKEMLQHLRHIVSLGESPSLIAPSLETLPTLRTTVPPPLPAPRKS